MELINAREAAKVLSISTGRLHHMTREGLLRAQLVAGANLYDPNEVYHLKELRAAGVTFVQVAAAAHRAEMASYRLERVVTQLLNVIGADIPSASVEDEAVVAQHIEVEDALKSPVPPTVDDVMYWARVFQSLSEQYFHVVSKQFLTGDPEHPYIKLSNKLLVDSAKARRKNDLEYDTACNYLEMARKSMRQTIFCYVQTTYDKRIAYKKIPEAMADRHEDMMARISWLAPSPGP